MQARVITGASTLACPIAIKQQDARMEWDCVCSHLYQQAVPQLGRAAR